MISFITDALIIILYFAIFSFIHTYLASVSFKRKLKNEYPDLLPFYRLIYNLIAFFSLYLIYELSPKPDLIIYDLSYPFDIVILIPQFIALAGIIWTAKYFSLFEFTGIGQVIRYFNGKYNFDEMDELPSLRIAGPYRFTRHPLYFFTILFLLFRPVMSLFYLVFMICIIGYFYVGSFYEERKLAEIFGDTYIKYAKDVPRIVPYKLFSPYKV